MDINVEHNLSNEELKKALAGMAIGSGIENELLETLSKAVCACDDKVPKTPKHRAVRTLYSMMQQAMAQAGKDIERYASIIRQVGLQKAVSPAPLTADQLRQLAQSINDRYGFIGAQIQSADYVPPTDLLERWKSLGLVGPDVTPETFLTSVPAEMRFIKNAFMMGKFIEAVEAGKTYQEVMALAANAPLLLPDIHAIAVAEQQTAMYLTDNAADLATKVGQLAIQKRDETIKQMAVEYHGRKLKRTILDEDAKREAGEVIQERYVENWQQFKSELHHTLAEKDRDLDRVAYYEITDAVKQGQAHKLMADGNVDKLVYKMPLGSACAQCRHLYLQKDGRTPRVFKLSQLVNNGTNIGRKPHPVKGGKVAPGGRTDGAETLKAVAGLVHPWCACMGPYEVTGHEVWLPEVKKSQMELFTEQHYRKDTTRHLTSGATVQVHNTTAAVHVNHSEHEPLPVGTDKPQEAAMTDLKEKLKAYEPTIAARIVEYKKETFQRIKELYGPDAKGKGHDGKTIGNGNWSKTWDGYRGLFRRDENNEIHLLDDAVQEAAERYAHDSMEAWNGKIISKVKDLQNTTVHHAAGNRFIITGERDGRKITIEQDMIVNWSVNRQPYNQFPARIYVDGKFTSEAAYKKLTGDDAIEKIAQDKAAEEKRAKNMLPSGLFAKYDKVKIKLVKKDGTRYETEGTVTTERNGKTVVRSGANRFNMKDYGIETEKLARWNGKTPPLGEI